MTAINEAVDTGLLERVIGEYREMPGLALTVPQAQRLWGCDAETCRCAMDVLIRRGILRRSSDGQLVRAGESH